MNPNEKEIPVDYDKPVAYDSNGKPLYAHPPMVSVCDSKVVDIRPIVAVNLKEQIVTDSAKPKHEKPSSDFELNLGEDEYVIMSVNRHPLGLFLPVFLGLILLILSLTLLLNVNDVATFIVGSDKSFDPTLLVLPILLFTALVGFGIYVVYYVFKSSKMFLTNERVVQIIQRSIFSKHEQIISLSDIDNVSFSQNGIIQQLFNFGSIKLSGEGVGLSYNFRFVADPKNVIMKINDAVELSKKETKVD